MQKKFKVPIIACSGSLSHWDLADPQSLISFVSLLGLELNEAKATASKIPEKIINQINERKGNDWIAPGIKVIK